MAGLAFSNMQQETPQSCVVDLTPPTGGAITAFSNNPDGSLKIQAAAASDPSLPLTYNYYLSQTLADLFDPSNVVARLPGQVANIYQDKNAVAIQANVTYYAGVRASDAVGNLNQNTTSLSVVATGLIINSLIQAVLETFIPPGQVIEVEVNQASLEIETKSEQAIKIDIEGC